MSQYIAVIIIVGVLMLRCRHCGSESLRKSGFTRNKQRYFCKLCEKNFVAGDKREKYSQQIRNAAMILYLEGCGFRSIERSLRKIFPTKIHHQLIIHWIKRLGLKVENAILEKSREFIAILMPLSPTVASSVSIVTIFCCSVW